MKIGRSADEQRDNIDAFHALAVTTAAVDDVDEGSTKCTDGSCGCEEEKHKTLSNTHTCRVQSAGYTRATVAARMKRYLARLNPLDVFTVWKAEHETTTTSTTALALLYHAVAMCDQN